MSFILRFVRIVTVINLSGGGTKNHYTITIEILAKVILVLKKSDINKVIRLTQRERGTTPSKMSNAN